MGDLPKFGFHGMTVFVLWHDNLCHAMEKFFGWFAKAAPDHPRCRSG